jgi:hypothetical protein
MPYSTIDAMNGAACSTIVRREAMLSKAVRFEHRERRSIIVLAVSGADAVAPMAAVPSTWADDAPYPEATKPVTRATIHSTVNGVARAGWRAAPIVVN